MGLRVENEINKLKYNKKGNVKKKKNFSIFLMSSTVEITLQSIALSSSCGNIKPRVFSSLILFLRNE